MTLTRQHFQLVADALVDARKVAESFVAQPAMDRGIDLAAHALADKFEATNPNFDRKRFLTAAGAAVELGK